ncbi:MAG: 8-amino-7-oxononanoate synthase [Kiritimatiellia bacterium]|nr:8-amino-7-oxononanoate synthase [Kiritimatiellia bacterium]
MKKDNSFPENWIEAELQRLREEGLERSLQTFAGVGGKLRTGNREVLNFSSNDYLGLAGNKTIISAAEKALASFGAGSGSSRLVVGTLPVHLELEKKMAEFKGYPAALVFGSGYLANLGVIPALAGKDDAIIADKLVHASLIDGAILSRANLKRFHHNDCDHLAQFLQNEKSARQKLVITESVFSMDGDLAPLKEISRVCAEYGAMLLVDEAHSTGVFGASGAGLVRELQIENRVTISMGTLSKAIGAYGGFVACSELLQKWLINRARSFIYSTSLPPVITTAALEALCFMKKNPLLGKNLLQNAARFRQRLKAAGFNTGNSASQIIPLIIGENTKTLRFAERLKEQGILAVAIRPPTVPEGTARIRLSVTLAHSQDDLDRAADQIVATARREGLL